MTNAGTALLDPQKIFEKIELRPGMRVADLGCGRTGHFVFPVSRIVGDTGVVYAVDVVKDILQSLGGRIRSEGFGNVQTIWSDIEVPNIIPIPSGSLDVCFFVNVMFLLKDRLSAIQEAMRLLKSGGRLVIIDWEKKLGPLGPEIGSLVKPDDIIRLATENNLTLLDNFKNGDYHYCLIFKKI